MFQIVIKYVILKGACHGCTPHDLFKILALFDNGVCVVTMRVDTVWVFCQV
jgi:hypothetical protein